MESRDILDLVVSGFETPRRPRSRVRSESTAARRQGSITDPPRLSSGCTTSLSHK